MALAFARAVQSLQDYNKAGLTSSGNMSAQEQIATGDIGNTYRGLFSDYFNSGGMAREDYMRNELSKQADYERSLEMLSKEQEFNANEAQKNRDFQLEMSNTAYQRAVEDLKKSGLSPLLAYQNGSASTPSGSTASASGSYSSSGNSASRGGHADTGGLLGLIGSLLNGSLQAGSRLASAKMLSKK